MPLQFAELNARTEETPSRSKRDYRAIEKKKKRQTNEQTYDKSRGLTACRVSTNFNDTLRGRSRNRRGCSAPQISGANDVSVFVFRFDANSVLSCNCNDPARSRPLPPLPPPRLLEKTRDVRITIPPSIGFNLRIGTPALIISLEWAASRNEAGMVEAFRRGAK